MATELPDVALLCSVSVSELFFSKQVNADDDVLAGHEQQIQYSLFISVMFVFF